MMKTLRQKFHATMVELAASGTSSAALIAILAWSISSNCAADPITLYYENRAPFAWLENNELTGIVGQPAIAAFKAAGIDYTLSEAPVARQLLMLQRDMRPSCIVGLYWTAERAKFGKYSQPIFRSLSQDVVMRADNPKAQAFNSMAALLDDPSIVIALRNGYSYGASMDAMLDRARAHLKRPPENSHGRIKLVLTGIADAALFTREEADYQIKQFGEEGKQLTALHFSDAPPGELRYLVCSNSVDDATIIRLNAVIKKLP